MKKEEISRRIIEILPDCCPIKFVCDGIEVCTEECNLNVITQIVGVVNRGSTVHSSQIIIKARAWCDEGWVIICIPNELIDIEIED